MRGLTTSRLAWNARSRNWIALIKECRTKGKGAATLAEKLEHQKAQRVLEATRNKKRRELFERQDDIQRKRDQLIDELEAQLQQQVHEALLFASRWELI